MADVTPTHYSMGKVAKAMGCTTRQAREECIAAGIAEKGLNGRWYARRAGLEEHYPQVVDNLYLPPECNNCVTGDLRALTRRSQDASAPKYSICEKGREIPAGWVDLAELARRWGWRTERARRWMTRHRLAEHGLARQCGRHWYVSWEVAEQDAPRSTRRPRVPRTAGAVARQYGLDPWLVRRYVEHLGLRTTRRTRGHVIAIDDVRDKLIPGIEGGDYDDFAMRHRRPVGKIGYDPREPPPQLTPRQLRRAHRDRWRKWWTEVRREGYRREVAGIETEGEYIDRMKRQLRGDLAAMYGEYRPGEIVGMADALERESAGSFF